MSRQLKILVVLPPYFAVSDEMGYGGTEKIAMTQIKALAARGHQLVVFARDGSSIPHKNVTLITYETNGFDLERVHANESIAVNAAIFALVEEYLVSKAVDIIFDHTESALTSWYNHPQAGKVVIQTHNDPARFGTMGPLASRQINLVAISHAQRFANREIRWQGTVHHGLPRNELLPIEAPTRDYLACLGRFDEVKGFREAIAVARATGILLKIAAPLREIDKPFFASVVQPAIDEGVVEYVGEVNMAGKQELLVNALALLALAKFTEPFGLYVIEAMACGTPVIASDNGALPEPIEHGKTGFICQLFIDDADEIVLDTVIESVKAIDAIDRHAVRAHFEERFTETAMAERLEKLFLRLLDKRGMRRVA